MKPYIIGIAGGSGSGKTTLIQMLQADLGSDRVTIVSQDDYYLPIEQQCHDKNGEVNFDLPEGVDEVQLKADIETIARGGEVKIKRYTFNNPNQLANEIRLRPNPILIVEGLFVFHYEALRSFFDLTVFVDASASTRYSRRLNRDTLERGYSEETIQYQWENHVEPAFRDFLLPYHSQCDIAIDNEQDMAKGIGEVMEHLHSIPQLHPSVKQGD
jgi:uridine kinase